MEILQNFSRNMHILFTFAALLFNSAGGYPSSNVTDMMSETSSENFSNNEDNLINAINCTEEAFNLEYVIFLNATDMFLKIKNTIVNYSDYLKRNGKAFSYLESRNNSKNKLITDCKYKLEYDSYEFQVFPNCSVLLFNDILFPGEYKLEDDKLFACAPNDVHRNIFIRNETLLTNVCQYVVRMGCSISVAALTIHVLIFCWVPALHNLPGYNLLSLSVAFIFAYLFAIIGHMPEVLGLFCVISGVLEVYFFLVAFFCMNVLAFDVWRTLKLGADEFIVGSNNVRKRQFLWYSLYAWGFPLVISSVSVLLDKIDGVPEKIKPYFGLHDICWMTNNLAITVFFVIPTATLFIINAVFFIWSFMIISSNTMKYTNEQQKQAQKLNYVLYLRLGLMMGLTWLMEVIATESQNDILRLIHALLNAFQGLFIFIFFTCTKKVLKHLKKKLTF